ncbi:hypothetical protein NKI51_02790 [Mesorhizobium australicum]|uniref:hypothetical protein n=1 Tax=Mesorhizobium TaxID=68287 RepID=UPI0003CE03EB|nr:MULTISPECIES: hypothetical protein [unclassified Mesorhizobium]ESY88055.1 hypothetical protein X739_07120 [Mesorhizobium sp. LNHC220B00]ESZ01084.1 hypothetical protein X738_06485 [Mesorhizobium sp. LNHC209A00]
MSRLNIRVAVTFSSTSALPLTVLPDISPRGTGRQGLALDAGILQATPMIGEIVDVSDPLPVTIYGERMPAGR